jgi:hypothetical protein
MEYRTAVDESEGDRQSDRRREVAPDYRTLVERICPEGTRCKSPASVNLQPEKWCNKLWPGLSAVPWRAGLMEVAHLTIASLACSGQGEL